MSKVTARYPCVDFSLGQVIVERAHYLFFTILGTGNQVYGLHVSDIDFVTKNVSEYNLRHVSRKGRSQNS